VGEVAQAIRLADEPDELSAVHDRQTPDLPVDHQCHRPAHRGLGTDGEDVGCHDRRDRNRAEPLALRRPRQLEDARDGGAEEIALREDADETASGKDRQMTDTPEADDVVRQIEPVRRFEGGHFGLHEIAHVHAECPVQVACHDLPAVLRVEVPNFGKRPATASRRRGGTSVAVPNMA